MPSLREEMEAKRRNRCYEESGHAAYVEFRPNPRTRQGFSVSQLLHYTLEPDPELPLDSPAPRDRLVFALSTADVVVFGARLALLADLVREHKLAAVWLLAERYSNLEPTQPFVSGITIRLLSDKSDKDSGGP